MVFIPTVEIPMLIMFFSQSLTGPVSTNLMLYRTCYILLGHNKTECSWLGYKDNNITKELENEVQPINNQISLTSQLSESIVTVVVSILIGPWSDKFGRRPVFLLTTVAMFASGVFGFIFSYFEDISPWYGLIGGIPSMLCGGIYSFITVANSYISELSRQENRGIRVAIFTVSITAGQILGTFGSSYLLDLFNYAGVMGIVAVLYFISILYTYFFIPESLTDIKKEGIIAGFFDATNVKEMYYTITKKRENYSREIIILFSLVGAFSTFIIAGEMQLMFLFMRQKFGWTMNKYTIYTGVQFSLGIIGTIVGVYLFQNILKMRESIASLICYSFMLVGSLIMGFASMDWEIYVVPIIRCFDGTVGPMSVTVVSKIVDKDELGKILAGMMGARFICTLISSPTYTAIYNATIDTNSSIFNFVSSGMFSLAIMILIGTIFVENKRNSLKNYKERLTKEQEDI